MRQAASRLIAAALLVAAAPLFVAAAPPAPTAADKLDQQVAERIATAHVVTTAVRPKPVCDRSGNGAEIVVCAPDHGADQRVPSTAETDPNSAEARRALNNGQLHAPQFDRGSCRGQPGCITGGYAPKPIYYIDVKSLPEAPAGSEADEIAKGDRPAP